jgi:phosphoribosylglycinamide formyltransferase 2
MVTLASQNLSEFALHVRAILGLAMPHGEVHVDSPAASAVVLGSEDIEGPVYGGVDNALAVHAEVDLRLFGKPSSSNGRRLGVVLARADSVDAARTHAFAAAMRIRATK